MKPPAAEPVHFKDDFEASSLIEVIERSLEAPAQATDPVALKSILASLCQSGSGDAFSEFLNRAFVLNQYQDSHLTGYYQPILEGSLERTDLYRYPLYAFSEGQLPNRENIDCAAALSGRGLEVAWVSDPVDLYFLHIQGSGKLQLPDGSTREILFAGHNAQPYFAIGTALLKRKLLTSEELSMQQIKHCLRNHPDQMQEILNLNPRYVFFKLGERGPIGTSGALLTPMRSIATDWTFCPPGSLCHLEVQLPQFDQQGKFDRFKDQSFYVVNQDTGGAITGQGRAELFTGAGELAGLLAGHLNSRGILSVFRN